MTIQILASDFEQAGYRNESSCPVAKALNRSFDGLWAEGVTHCARIDLKEPREYSHAKYGVPEYRADLREATKANFSFSFVVRTIHLT